MMGKLIMPEINLYWVDPFAAIIVALLIIRAAYHLTLESARDLIDVGLPEDETEHLRRHIAAFAPTIRGIHKNAHQKGGSRSFCGFSYPG